MLGMPVRRFGWINLPFTLMAIVTGSLLGFWGVSRSVGHVKASNTAPVRRLLTNVFPLIFALFLTLAFKVELVYAFGVTILGMVIFFQIQRPVVLKALKESLSGSLLLTGAAVMGFKQVLESSHAIPAVSSALSSSGVPLWLIAMFIPFLVGWITGSDHCSPGHQFPDSHSLVQGTILIFLTI